MRGWLDQGLPIERIAVNLSPRQFEFAGLCDRISAILAETGLPAHCLEIEITETALMQKDREAEIKLKALKALGLRVAIDDFGTGYSSLTYLKRFSFDTLKVDRSFVADIPSDPTSMEIAATVVGLGRSLKVEVLAEGVETRAQADFLAVCGCVLAQGFTSPGR